MKVSVKLLKEFFLEMAADTYSSGSKVDRVPERFWEREFRRQRGKLTYIDRYVVNGEYSGGSTLILAENTPVWLMQYHGWCKNDDESVLLFLKKALNIAYSAGEFRGGRGPEYFHDGDSGFTYTNVPLPTYYRLGDFTNFQGRERIWRLPQSDDIFWHRYQGMLLFSPE